MSTAPARLGSDTLLRPIGRGMGAACVAAHTRLRKRASRRPPARPVIHGAAIVD